MIDVNETIFTTGQPKQKEWTINFDAFVMFSVGIIVISPIALTILVLALACTSKSQKLERKVTQ